MYRHLMERAKMITLECGYQFIYIDKLDGGGSDQRFDFLNVIKKYGRANYDHAYEWCAGFGMIGFELLGHGLCNNIHFSDLYYPAIVNCNDNAKLNNISDKVTTYLSYRVQDIHTAHKWDLVVGNPPHHFNEQGFTEFILQLGQVTRLDQLENPEQEYRITCDDDMRIHKEFFSNIGSKLNDNADLFISSVYQTPENCPIIDLATSNNLKYIDYYDTTLGNSNNMYIFHFKAN